MLQCYGLSPNALYNITRWTAGTIAVLTAANGDCNKLIKPIIKNTLCSFVVPLKTCLSETSIKGDDNSPPLSPSGP